MFLNNNKGYLTKDPLQGLISQLKCSFMVLKYSVSKTKIFSKRFRQDKISIFVHKLHSFPLESRKEDVENENGGLRPGS